MTRWKGNDEDDDGHANLKLTKIVNVVKLYRHVFGRYN